LGIIQERREPHAPAEIEQHLNARPRFPDDMLELWRSERTASVERLYKPQPRRDDLPDILTLAGQYTELRPRGRQWWGKCPKHAERTPSFSVDPTEGWFYFHEGKGGGPRQFLDWLGVSHA